MGNIALVFAGGSGRRMNTNGRPKQFLEFRGKPIIIYTLELFDNHPKIEGIIVVCLKEWIPYLEKMLRKFEVTKVKSVVPGGTTGQDSIYVGLKAVDRYYSPDSIVLIHDGVRPLIMEQTISDNIECVREYGSCITCVPATETFIVSRNGGGLEIPSRSESFIARAPQSFILSDILSVHQKAQRENRHDFIDSCSMMNHYGYNLHTIMGPMENIKITTPTDFFIFKAMVDVHENQQIFGF
ncbi:IspD/TarI family cytidylyltransferase [Parabacteroides sp.]|uniref:IspD/TarI family cytidylyltransferase n=1 Tax=Parabacteroides sp. TaxID=1869337 RepID=UPI00257FBD97|nr:IspD/TarI family cytidylyltransferase [Parabacteroides sp.]